MLVLPLDLIQKFQALLTQAGVPINQRSYYHKWLRYYLDFCHKYRLEPSKGVILGQSRMACLQEMAGGKPCI